MQQLAGAVLCVIFIDLGFRAWIGGSLHDRALLVLSLGCYVCAFVCARGIFDQPRRWVDLAYPALCIIALLGGLALHALTSDVLSHYASDALAFNQYSAQLLLHGRDPYGADMTPAYAQFGVPLGARTPSLQGGLVTIQSYPALGFLVYVPFLLVGISNVLWVNVALLVAAVLLAYALVPPESRIAAGVLVVAVQEFVYFALGAVTDIVWVVPMVAVAACWDAAPEWAALWLGIACAVKQAPWFVVPLALVFWWRVAANSAAPPKRYARLVGIFSAAFLVPNLAFIIWNAPAWLRGVFGPLSAHPRPFGTGFVQLLASGALPPAVALLTLPWIFALAICLYVYVRYPQKYRWLPFLTAPVVLFFGPLSTANYFMYWPLVAYVYAARMAPAAEPA